MLNRKLFSFLQWHTIAAVHKSLKSVHYCKHYRPITSERLLDAFGRRKATARASCRDIKLLGFLKTRAFNENCFYVSVWFWYSVAENCTIVQTTCANFKACFEQLY